MTFCAVLLKIIEKCTLFLSRFRSGGKKTAFVRPKMPYFAVFGVRYAVVYARKEIAVRMRVMRVVFAPETFAGFAFGCVPAKRNRTRHKIRK